MKKILLMLILLAVSLSAKAGEDYFPQGILSDTAKLDEFRREWYSRHLKALQEPSIYRSDSVDGAIYRFLWLRTFHAPIAIRITANGESWSLHVKKTDGAGGYKEGTLVENSNRQLSNDEAKGIIEILGKKGFWEIPTREGTNRQGKDGAQWILEGRDGERYHIIDWWSPEAGPVRDIGMQFIQMAGIEIGRLY